MYVGVCGSVSVNVRVCDSLKVCRYLQDCVAVF